VVELVIPASILVDTQVGNDRLPGPEPDDRIEPDVTKLLERYEWLVGRLVADGWNEATVLPQLHPLVWDN
jgi:7-carboxy-7-deazaguanine synthase